MRLGLWCCVPWPYPGQCGPDGSPGPQLSGDDHTRDWRRRRQPGDLRTLLSPILQRSDPRWKRVDNASSSSDPILVLRIKEGAHRPRQTTSTVELMAGRPPKGTTADSWCFDVAGPGTVLGWVKRLVEDTVRSRKRWPPISVTLGISEGKLIEARACSLSFKCRPRSAPGSAQPLEGS